MMHENIGPRLKLLRKKRLHLTQREFAQRFHIPYVTYRRWERGYYRPHPWAQIFLGMIEENPLFIGNLLNAFLGITPRALVAGRSDVLEVCAALGHA
ncbi:MAG: helix-turn-helix domain-containing protein [Candidatus Moraniibacteriota bacterium]